MNGAEKWTLLTMLVCAVSPLQAQHPPPIVSISVCNSSGAGGFGSCPSGTFDTHQIVLGPGGVSVNKSGFDPAPDEHSTVFAPGALGSNKEYLFFLASSEAGHAAIGVAVLSGGSGPNKNGQWTLDFPRADGYGSYAGGFGQVFNPSTKGDVCPAVADGNPAHQDQTFDVHYAAPGSIVKDPTSAAGALLMVYEGTNACIGNAGGPILNNSDDYISLAIATSLDYGKSWPTYRGTPTFNFVPLPGFNSTQAPNAPMGALGKNVCMGNDCSTTPPASYGRYPVLTPPTSLASLMAAAKPLTSKLGEQEISGFVDDIAGSPAPYLYVNSGNVRVARAQLNGGGAPLTFLKWNGQAFASPGLGGAETSVLPAGPFENCESSAQNQFGSSISYLDDTQQYLLTFLCDSPGDPARGQQVGAARGAAWFWSTSYDLSDQTQWTAPLEIAGSWSEFDQSGGCPDYKGYYPTFTSLGKSAGRLSLTGYVFYLFGCQAVGTPGGRQFSSRAFMITTAPALPVPQIGSGGIVNNASYVGSGAAPGEIAAIFGVNLTDGTSCLPPSCNPTFGSNGKLNTKMAGAEVSVNGTPVPIFYATPGQLGVQIPFELTGMSASVMVSVGGQASAPAIINLAAVSPGIFTATADGKGAGAITHVNGAAVTTQNRAQPAELVILYATGLASVAPAVPTGALPAGISSTVTSVTLNIGGITVVPDFAGLAGCCVGLNQINARIPAAVNGGDAVPVVLNIGGKSSNMATIAIKNLSPPPPGTFYVAPNGNDSWSGTLATPNTANTDGPFYHVRPCPRRHPVPQ